jgi:hypothetical protein
MMSEKQNLKLLFLIAFSVVFSLSAQVIIKNFVAQPANSSQLLVTWTVGAGSQSCSDLQLYWSTDSFATTNTWVYTLPTVCGVSGSDENYSFQHTNPEPNGKNYYRLTSFAAPVSPIIVYDFAADNGGYKLFPHPLTDGTIGELSFKNPGGDLCVIEISNSLTSKRYSFGNNYSDKIQLPADWFETGIYFFRIYSLNGKLIKGKFIVIHN